MGNAISVSTPDRITRGSITFDPAPSDLSAYRTGAGFALSLPMTVTLGLNNRNDPCPHVSHIRATLSYQTESGGICKVGRASTNESFVAGTPHSTTPGELVWTEPLASLAYYEKLRGGKPPRLKIELRGELCFLVPRQLGPHRLRTEPYEIFGDAEVTYPIHVWANMLRQLGVAEVILLEVPLRSDAPTGWDGVWRALQDARSALDRGGETGWRDCVVAVRRALEEWGKIEEERMWPNWKGPTREERDEWSKRERLDGLRWHLHQCAHLAPHSDARDWTREDAILLLSTLSGLLAVKKP